METDPPHSLPWHGTHKNSSTDERLLLSASFCSHQLDDPPPNHHRAVVVVFQPACLLLNCATLIVGPLIVNGISDHIPLPILWCCAACTALHNNAPHLSWTRCRGARGIHRCISLYSPLTVKTHSEFSDDDRSVEGGGRLKVSTADLEYVVGGWPARCFDDFTCSHRAGCLFYAARELSSPGIYLGLSSPGRRRLLTQYDSEKAWL